MSTGSFPVVLVMLSLAEHDPSVLAAVGSSVERLGIQTVLLAHVSPVDPLAGALGVTSSGAGRAELPPGLLAARDALQAKVPGLTVELEHAVGAPDAVLADLIERRSVDLLVIGRLTGSDGKAGWGPSGRKLLRTIDCSALVIPQGSSMSFEQAVVGLDFSNHAAHALEVASAIFDHTTAVCQYDLRTARQGSIEPEEFTAQLVRNAQDHFDSAVAPRLSSDRVPSLEVLAGDRASDVLLERAAGQVLVVGSRGLTRIATLLLGSTAERLAGVARSPVLIVRKKGEVLSLLEGLFHR